MRQVTHTFIGRSISTLLSMTLILLLAGHSIAWAIQLEGEGGGGGDDPLPYTTDDEGNVTINTAPDGKLGFSGVDITYLGTVDQNVTLSSLLRLSQGMENQVTINASASLINHGSQGISFSHTGSIENHGTLKAGYTAIFAASTIINAADGWIQTTSAGDYAIDAYSWSQDIILIDNDGTIMAAGDAIQLSELTYSTIENNGLIQGLYGIKSREGYHLITNQEDGQILATECALSIQTTNLSHQKSIITNENLIQTDHSNEAFFDGYLFSKNIFSAIFANNYELNNSGQILGNNAYGFLHLPSRFGAEYLNTEIGTSTINNQAGGLIQSDIIAIRSFDSDLVVNNDGTIKRAPAAGVDWDTDMADTIYPAAIQSEAAITLYNNEQGIIESDGYAIVIMPDSDLTFDSDHKQSVIVNKGTLRATDDDGYAIHTTGRGLDLTLHTGSSTSGKIAFDSDYLDENQLTLTGTGDSHLSDSIEGKLSIVKQGAGTWTLGNSDQPIDTRGGIVEVKQGRLDVYADMFIGSNLYVRSGATLGGGGNIISFDDSDAVNVIIQDQATLALGNSEIGDMDINAPLIFEDGSTLQAKIFCIDSANDVHESDQLYVSSITVGQDTTLHLIDLSNADQQIQPDQLLTIVNSDTPIVNGFSQVTDTSAILDFEQVIVNPADDQIDSKTPYTLSVQARATSCYDDHAQSDNQHAVAGVLDQAVIDGCMTDLTGKLNPLSADQLRKEFKRLQPNVSPMQTIFSNAQQVSTDTFRAAHLARSGKTNPGQSMMAQLADEPFTLAQNDQTAEQVPAAEKLHVYASPFGQFGRIDETDNRTGYNFEAYGAIVGVDYQCLNNTAMGFSLGYINTDIGMNDNFGDSNVNTMRFGPYLSYEKGPWTIDASVTGGLHWVDANRNTINGVAKSDYNSYDITLYGAANYDIQLGDWLLTPTASLTYIHQMTDSYTEAGAGSANLNVDDLDTDSLQSLIGMHVRRDVMLGNIALTPEAWIGWKYQWLDQDINLNAVFASNATTSFNSASDGTARSQLVTGLAIASQISDNTKFKCNYEWQTSSDTNIHTVWAMIELNF